MLALAGSVALAVGACGTQSNDIAPQATTSPTTSTPPTPTPTVTVTAPAPAPTTAAVPAPAPAQPAPSPSQAQPTAPKFSAFAGKWTGHGRDLKIDANGHGVVSYRTYAPAPAPLMETGSTVFQIDKVTGTNAHANILSSSTPKEWGKSMTLTFTQSAGAPAVKIVPSQGSPDALWTFCTPQQQNANLCGA